ncbi:hypothetical protein EW146_g4267 [Bondarzewia mesenterica]|uniref:AB hydrolase-1 domain-containing protein n=1 Tax=Bondarzewia mesenterica TaxID=1095465 RepID=A0A4S4LV19_9AGAM|nr:hypothetical protein EW146_g4267 [Bondarzewia mesenterica]
MLEIRLLSSSSTCPAFNPLQVLMLSHLLSYPPFGAQFYFLTQFFLYLALALAFPICAAVLSSVTWYTPASLELFFSVDSANIARNTSSSKEFREQTIVDLLRRKVPSLFRPDAGFSSVSWLPNGHAQTIYTSVADLTKIDIVQYERTLIRVPDGGTLALDMAPSLSSRPRQANEPVLLVTHGLTGGSHESYVRAALARLTNPPGLRFRAVVMNSRGCNQSPVTSPKLYHAGTTDDIRHTVLWIAHTFPGSPIYGLGFSLGANALTKYAGEEGDACPLTALASVANVWDFVRGSHAIERGSLFNRLIYNNILGGSLRALLLSHAHAFLSPSSSSPALTAADIERLAEPRVLSLRQYDALVTCQLYGFASPDDYYARISSAHFLPRVRVPILALNAADDPIAGASAAPVREALVSPWVVLGRTAGGGHLGWFERGKSGGVERWYVRPVSEFLRALCEYDPALRPRVVPTAERDTEGFVRQVGRADVGFREVDPAQVMEAAKGLLGWRAGPCAGGRSGADGPRG